MLKSKSENQIKTNIKDVYISQVQYKSCGMTIVSSKKKLDFYIDKRGKNIYGLGTDVLYGHKYTAARAICLVGSSTLGLEGICGVNQALIEENGFKHNSLAIGSCCNSFNMNDRDFTHPDVKLGKYGFKNRDKHLLIGEVGCGVNTRIGKLYCDWRKTNVVGGQGAFYLEKDKMKCFCIIVLNSIGVVHENGILLHKFKVKSKDITNINQMPKDIAKYLGVDIFDTSVNVDCKNIVKKNPGNTTLTIFLTNVEYDEDEMKILSKKLHDVVESMIYPYGTYYDGDIFFLASTKEIKTTKNYLNDYKEVVRNAIKSPFIDRPFLDN
jgi:L-aminopeptidase/D-esterase-like protein